MKRYGNLYSKIYSIENIELAHKNAKKSKSHYSEVKKVEANPEKYFIKIHNMLKDKTFCNSEYEIFIRNDRGKEREIFKLPYFPDRIIHHCIMNILEPIWMKTLITDTYSSLKGRGVHKGVKRIKQALKDRLNTKYCLKMDVRKFYPSIDHNILKQTVRKKIKDKDLLWLLDKIVESARGVPIGNYLSQYFGNLYLSVIDHWLKEQNKCKYYFRYCDDMVVLNADKKYLSKLRKTVFNYLKMELNIKLKSNWQIFPVDKRGIDFLGYRFFHNYILLRKRIVIGFKRRIKQIKKKHRSLTPINIVSGVMSYRGWMQYADCYKLWNKYIDENIKQIINNVCIVNQINNPLSYLEMRRHQKLVGRE
jgi:hypothetical protein